MALSSTEQLQLIEAGFDNLTYPLNDVIYQEALIKAGQFLENQKDTTIPGDPPTVDRNAEAYRSKISSPLNAVFKGRYDFRNFEKILIARIGSQTSLTYDELRAASETQITTFISDNIVPVFEFVAGVEPKEKTAYTAL